MTCAPTCAAPSAHPRCPCACAHQAARAAGSQTIAALFVQERGCYADLPGVDPWPQSRDAMKYQGPHPVVAHPPCQLWGALANVNFARWGGDHNRPGNDGGTFAFALDAVVRWGGVLEHPAGSRAWAAHDLTAPQGAGWQRTPEGWVCEVWQSAYGHRANKRTWLLFVGDMPNDMRWERPIGTHQVGFQDQRGKDRNKPTLSKAEANATPVAFRDELIGLARAAGSQIRSDLQLTWGRLGRLMPPSADTSSLSTGRVSLWHPAFF
jgi:hypothetical protein